MSHVGRTSFIVGSLAIWSWPAMGQVPPSTANVCTYPIARVTSVEDAFRSYAAVHNLDALLAAGIEDVVQVRSPRLLGAAAKAAPASQAEARQYAVEDAHRHVAVLGEPTLVRIAGAAPRFAPADCTNSKWSTFPHDLHLPKLRRFQPVAIFFLGADGKPMLIQAAAVDSIVVSVNGYATRLTDVQPYESLEYYQFFLGDLNVPEPNDAFVTVTAFTNHGSAAAFYARLLVDNTVEAVSPETKQHLVSPQERDRAPLLHAGSPLKLVFPDAGQLLDLRQVGADSVAFVIGGTQQPALKPPANRDTLSWAISAPDPRGHARNGDLIVAKVFLQSAVVDEAFRYAKSGESYGVVGPIWLPVGLFTAHRAAGSVRLSPSPIGLGAGWKKYSRRFGGGPDAYWGLSAIGTWVIDPATDEKGAYNLRAFGGGFILDLANWVYIGGDMVARSGEKPFKGVIVGPGPRLIQTLQLIHK